MGQEAEESTLQEVTFNELFNSGRLPSGAPFELMPDTVEVALAVAEVNDPYQWKKKALQAFTITKKVADVDVQEKGGPSFIWNLLDTDVVFISLAWTAQLNGTRLDIDDGGVPCPTCNTPFKYVDFGDLKIHCREPGAQPRLHKVEGVDDEDLPKSMRGGQLAIGDMTWMAARKTVSEQSWESVEAVKMHRVLAGLRLLKSDSHRDVLSAESRKMKARVLRGAAQVMDAHVPHFAMQLDLKCEKCGEVSIVPFTQGLG